MTEEIKEQPKTAITIFQDEDTKKKFSEILWKKSTSFLTSIMSMISQSDMLKDCQVKSMYLAAMTAATLDLPINANLWFAYIIPFKNWKTWETLAQFQLWYKWLVQLSLRSNQFYNIDVKEVYEWQYVEDDTSFVWYSFKRSNKINDKIVWYVA